eukprot:CAMPEP_0119525240 /NCGR_PEP_ID=MMETSP1344-20130328/40075_1 /TAXON_ID=236787 /ORGANISM="Florenciella parvula, Strain CCMP2471" /LENGTH=40 /DNA_ID= /DNA_START= /DNA_END= /DNA_ORIENTATION=
MPPEPSPNSTSSGGGGMGEMGRAVGGGPWHAVLSPCQGRA